MDIWCNSTDLCYHQDHNEMAQPDASERAFNVVPVVYSSGITEDCSTDYDLSKDWVSTTGTVNLCNDDSNLDFITFNHYLRVCWFGEAKVMLNTNYFEYGNTLFFCLLAFGDIREYFMIFHLLFYH